MKSKLILSGILILVFVALSAVNWTVEAGSLKIDPEANDGEFTARLDNTVPELMKKYDVPGTAVALVEKGRIVHLKGYGAADRKTGAKVDGNTIFQVASNSKTVTAFGVMKLVENGILDLDVPVSKYLIRWKLPRSKFNNGDVTLRRILSHTAGLSQGAYPGYLPGDKLPTLEESLSGKAPGTKALHLARKPGKKYSYSGGGYTLIQLIMEEATGKPFAGYMESYVLKPLGMLDSSFVLKPDFAGRVSKAYDVFGHELPNYLFTEQAAAGLYTTAADFARFIEANIRICMGEAGSAPITQNSQSVMLTPVKKDYGFGFIINELPDGSRLIYHGGTNRGWRSQFAILPERGDGLVVLTNSDNGESLHADLLCLWTRWETGYYPGSYLKNILGRTLVKSGAEFILLILIFIMSITIFGMARRKRSFIRNNGKAFPQALLKSLAAAALSVLWCVVFYTGEIYNGWVFVSLMPAGFKWLTASVLLSSLCYACMSWTEKRRMPDGSGLKTII